MGARDGAIVSTGVGIRDGSVEGRWVSRIGGSVVRKIADAEIGRPEEESFGMNAWLPFLIAEVASTIFEIYRLSLVSRLQNKMILRTSSGFQEARILRISFILFKGSLLF